MDKNVKILINGTELCFKMNEISNEETLFFKNDKPIENLKRGDKGELIYDETKKAEIEILHVEADKTFFIYKVNWC